MRNTEVCYPPLQEAGCEIVVGVLGAELYDLCYLIVSLQGLRRLDIYGGGRSIYEITTMFPKSHHLVV